MWLMTSILLLFVLALALGEVAGQGAARKLLSQGTDIVSSRISGGVSAKPREYPWMANIALPSGRSCGGVLVSCNHVLTAAHCIEPFEKSRLIEEGKVRLGGISSSTGVTFRIRDAVVHPDFDPDGFDSKSDETIHNDLAMLVLDGVADIRPVAIGRKQPAIGAKGVILGWGETESSSSSSLLQKTKVSIYENEACEGTVPKIYFDTDSSICAGPDLDRPGGSYTSACSGDSGGPMIDERSNTLLGIISYSFGTLSSDDCGDKRQTILASVQDGMDMIIDTMEDSLNDSCRMPIKPDDQDLDDDEKPDDEKLGGKKPGGKKPGGKKPGGKKPGGKYEREK